ncbi:MAG: nicotinate-nucleotide adenylyltransferase [Candidatus Aminicenantes bacterium]|jgi:nicotinate (nicotinamide) nucleotide adenylyltransferase/ribosome silencing factor RsfS/YbeB/iojap
MKKERIGLFGGTFNPIHSGHIMAAEIVRKRLSLEKILFIPSYIPPHKDSAEIASPSHRLKMVELSLQSYPHFVPSSIEVDAEEKSYSIITLGKVEKLNPNAQLFFILGIDAFLEIDTWKSYEKLLEKCFFVVISRPGFRLKEAKAVLKEIHREDMCELSESETVDDDMLLAYRVFLLKIDALDIASTDIRKRTRRGESINTMVPVEVEAYIKENKLYQSEIMTGEKPKQIMTKRSLPPEVKISVKASLAKKGEELVILDLRGIASFTDFFIILHGNSSRQNKAIYESVEKELKENNVKPLSVEGGERAEWILMDFGSFIVHIFSREAREYYSLEKLWGDAPKLTY